jgi:uncharacterized membrane protein YqhA
LRLVLAVTIYASAIDLHRTIFNIQSNGTCDRTLSWFFDLQFGYFLSGLQVNYT